MITENRFNLIDEGWIPVADSCRIGLGDIFTRPAYRTLGGNPLQKIAIMKLLQAIAQAAATPADEPAWQSQGWQGMADKVCAYLEKWRDRFYLYGEQPFLQMPAIARAEKVSFGTVLPDVASGNTTVLTQFHTESPLDDGDRALLLLVQMGFALGGKQTDNSVVLTPGYQGKTKENGKPTSGKPGPGLAFKGLLHNYFLGTTLLKSLWLNLFTEHDIASMRIYPHGLGTAPWERMPQGEDCKTARQLKAALMGRLVPLSRFCLLGEDGLHYSEGIAHDNYKEGIWDPSVAVAQSGKEVKVRWAVPDKSRFHYIADALDSLFLKQQAEYSCIQLERALPRVRQQTEPVAIWFGGLRVSMNMGEQYVSGADDMVESLCWLTSPSRQLTDKWVTAFTRELEALNTLSKMLYANVINYYSHFSADGFLRARPAVQQFWQLADWKFRDLLEHCDDPDECQKIRHQFAGYITRVFNQTCPRQTALQMQIWAKNKPFLGKYLKKEEK